MELNAVQALSMELSLLVMGLFLGYKCSSLRKDNMNFFFEFVAALNVFLIINIPIRMSEIHILTLNRSFLFCLYAVSVILMTFTMAHWFVFDMMLVKSRLADTSLKRVCCFIPAFFIIPLCVVNYWTGWLYVIDEASQYSRGSLFFLQAAVSYAYFLVLLIGNCVRLIIGNEKDAAKKCFMASIPGIGGAILQIIYGGSYLLIGIVFGAWLIYIDICLSRQKAYELSDAIRSINDDLIHTNKEVVDNMHTILALSDIYHTLYEVDLEQDTFKEIKALKVVSDFCSKYTSARECMKGLASALFDEGYVGIMNLMFDPDTIDERLKDTNSYYTDAIAYYSRMWTRTTIIVTERNDDGRVRKIVLTFQLIDDIIEQQKKLEEAKIYEIHAYEMKELFTQTAQSLVSAIDAKDKYTRGHSLRVAQYSRKIAELSGKNETECEQIYFAGLLHDVGKIGIPEAIICKEGRLTEDEYNIIKTHPVLGNDILQKINRMPFLSIGANYHHERYDGKGYPEGLEGEKIPEIARIIAVADAYDAMTSKRSYRNTIPQQTVREEVIMGMGTQFDPKYAKIMLHLIDKDIEYDMQEHETLDTEEERKDLFITENRSIYSLPLRITDIKSRIHFNYTKTADDGMPAFILYDSGDAKVHKGDKLEKQFSYYEYGEIRLDGRSNFDWVRATRIESFESPNISDGTCDIEIVKDSDHLYFKMLSEGKVTEGIVALPDNTHYVYICITGENCNIYNISDGHDEEPIKAGTIKKIAEPITYLSGIEGDLPSIQADGYRTATTLGTLINSHVEMTFDMKNLPFAERIWHCPYIIIYHSADGEVKGPNYREYGVIRINGESWGEIEGLSNKISVEKVDEFPGWNQWKEDNKAGRNCRIVLEKEDHYVTLHTTNGGVAIENITEVEDGKEIYVSISGDQSVIENIKVQKAEE